MPFVFAQFLSLGGQQVKVKNTFLDDIVAMDEIDEQTPTLEALVERASQTCPEFSLPREEDRHGNETLQNQACDEAVVTLEWALHMAMEEQIAGLPVLSSFEAPSRQDDAMLQSGPGQPAVATIVNGDSTGPMMPADMSAQRAEQIQAEHVLPASLKPVLSTMPLGGPARDTPQAQHVDTLGRQRPCLPGRIPPPAMPAPVLLPATRSQGCPAIPPPRLHGGCPLEEKDVAPEDSDCAADLEHMHEDAADSIGNRKEALEQPSSLDQLTSKKNGKTSRRRVQPKVWCHFFIDPLMVKTGFELNKKVIGHGGANTWRIFDKTDAKIRLRGCGSGHKEINGKEAPVHLMLAVTSNIGQETNFLMALKMSAELLQQVTDKYREFCQQWSLPLPTAPLFWIGELSQKAQEYLGHSAAEGVARFGDLEVPLILEGPGKKKASHVRHLCQ